jgi:adenylate kinase family enzyme
MRRVMVIGCSGAGKSTFARNLADRTGLPFVPLDRAYWLPGWTMPEPEQWRKIVAELAAAPAWVMDGNYAGTFDLRMPLADMIVWFDHPRGVCLRRAILRALRDYGRVRDDMGPGCPEKFDLAFLKFIWDFPAKQRPRIEQALAQFGRNAQVSRVADDRTAAALLAEIN